MASIGEEILRSTNKYVLSQEYGELSQNYQVDSVSLEVIRARNVQKKYYGNFSKISNIKNHCQKYFLKYLYNVEQSSFYEIIISKILIIKR